MFAIDHQPVKACSAHDFGGDGLAKAAPAADLALAILEGLFETIDRRGHI
jgi:hypothetical protein